MGKFNNKREAKEKTKEYHQNICRKLVANVKEIRGKWLTLKGITKMSKAKLRLIVRFQNRKVYSNLLNDLNRLRAMLDNKNFVHQQKTWMKKMGILSKMIHPPRLLWPIWVLSVAGSLTSSRQSQAIMM